jgi:hypothetical protein
VSESDAARLRRRADIALARADRLVDRSATDGLDEAILELADIEGLMGPAQPSVAHDVDLVWQVRTALGSLYASRWLHRGRAEADKSRGVRLLRAARDCGGLNADDHYPAMRLLVVLLLPGDSAGLQPGTFAGLRSAIAIGELVTGGGQAVADLEEMRELLAEIRAARPDDPRTMELAAAVGVLDGLPGIIRALMSGSGTAGAQIKDLLSPLPQDPSNPLGSMIDALLPLLHTAGPARPSGQASALEPPEAGPEVNQESISDGLGIVIGVTAPGAMRADELHEAIERLNEASGSDKSKLPLAALVRFAEAVRTNDPDKLNEAIRTLQSVFEDPATADESWLGNTVFPAMLAASSMAHGNLQDAAKAARQLQGRSLLFVTESLLHGAPGTAGLAVGRLILDHSLRASVALNDEDDEALQGLLRELEEAERAADPTAETYFLIPFELAVTELCLAIRRQDADRLRGAVRHLETALDASTTAPAAVRSLMESAWPAALALSARVGLPSADLTEAIARAHASLETTPSIHDQQVHARLSIALALKAQRSTLDGAGRATALDDAINELEQARNTLTERTAPAMATMVLWELAEAYRERDDSQFGDTVRAVAGALESLRLLSDDVLLQTGTEDGLRKAKLGSGRGLRAAGWALSIGQIDEALECLELGRAMVLGAAAAAGTIPDRLRVAGEDVLADEWVRAALPGATEEYLSVPSDLRQRVLRTLRRAEASRRLVGETPSCALITEQLRRSDVDALIYLLPETADSAGRAVVIRADGTACDVLLPGLAAAAREPFEQYLGSSAQRFARVRGADGTRDLKPGPGWEDALNRLCAWAGSAVVSPLINALPTEPTPDQPARIVFVPCGLLGLVPWQAALLDHEASGELARPVRACDLLVISYAASAAELLRSLARVRTPYHANPVFVVDPSGTLHYAGPEAVAIQHAYLPDARFMGFVEGRPVESPGTPEEVLTQFTAGAGAAPASMVQISAHGTAGAGPTTSRLLLAAPSPEDVDAEPAHDKSRSAGVGPEYLTVARILESARPGETARIAPLVVLDCCETDLTSRDHDEALTLTTAFVARGATDAIGSRWSIDDWSTAVCVIVFHHYLATRHLTPADALRAAQRWMLGPAPAREPIPALTEELLSQGHQPLDTVSSWAPFIHQGNAGT